MPKAEIPAGSAKAVASGLYGPTSWANIFYYDLSVLPPGTELQVAQDIGYATVDLYNKLGYAHFSNNWSNTRVRVLYRALDGSFIKSTTVATAVGTDSSGDQDAQVAYLINWTTADHRRGGKPRNYVSGVPLDACADSATITSDFLGAMNSGLADWLATLGDGSLPNATVTALCEMSFVDLGVDLDPPVIYDITSGDINPIVATQRRRVDRLRTS